jgi:hypothetical protein
MRHTVVIATEGTAMMSRLTASAALFAILSAATLTFAAGKHPETATGPVTAASAAPVVQLAPVQVIGRRTER